MIGYCYSVIVFSHCLDDLRLSSLLELIYKLSLFLLINTYVSLDHYGKNMLNSV